MKNKCFCCEKNLKNECNKPLSACYDAVAFDSNGNFGSSIFDPFELDARIMIHICDSCLKKKAKLVCYHQQKTIKQIENLQTFDKKLKKDELAEKKRDSFTKKVLERLRNQKHKSRKNIHREY